MILNQRTGSGLLPLAHPSYHTKVIRRVRHCSTGGGCGGGGCGRCGGGGCGRCGCGCFRHELKESPCVYPQDAKLCTGALDGQQLLAIEGSKNSAEIGHSTSKRTECEKWREYCRKTTHRHSHMRVRRTCTLSRPQDPSSPSRRKCVKFVRTDASGAPDFQCERKVDLSIRVDHHLENRKKFFKKSPWTAA